MSAQTRQVTTFIPYQLVVGCVNSEQGLSLFDRCLWFRLSMVILSVITSSNSLHNDYPIWDCPYREMMKSVNIGRIRIVKWSMDRIRINEINLTTNQSIRIELKEKERKEEWEGYESLNSSFVSFKWIRIVNSCSMNQNNHEEVKNEESENEEESMSVESFRITIWHLKSYDEDWIECMNRMNMKW